jgi:NADH-quinone oxidoreductase subunit I
MQAAEVDDPKERYPEFFEINMLRCIYCGFCEDVCPEEAIVMSQDYDIVFESREDAIYAKDRLLVPKEELTTRLDYLREYKNKQFGQFWDFQEENNAHSVRNRDKRWERIKEAYDLIVDGKGTPVTSILDAMQESYDEGVTDEFMKLVNADPKLREFASLTK